MKICVDSLILLFFSLWYNTHNIKFTTLVTFKCTVPSIKDVFIVVQPTPPYFSELACFRGLMSAESHGICPFVTGLFH